MYWNENNLAVGEGWVCHVGFNVFVVQCAVWAHGLSEPWIDS